MTIFSNALLLLLPALLKRSSTITAFTTPIGRIKHSHTTEAGNTARYSWNHENNGDYRHLLGDREDNHNYNYNNNNEYPSDGFYASSEEQLYPRERGGEMRMESRSRSTPSYRQHDAHVPRDNGDILQGGARATFRSNPNSYDGYSAQKEVFVRSPEGRPVHTKMELWEGPNNSPMSVNLYSEDGSVPFRTKIDTPNRNSVVSVNNIGPAEYPVAAHVESVGRDRSLDRSSPWRPDTYYNGNPNRDRGVDRYSSNNNRRSSTAYAPPQKTTVQGGALRTMSFASEVQSVHVALTSEGRPMNCTVELWGVGSHVKQIAEIYSEDGNYRPFSALVDTPGDYNTIAVRNTGPMAYPIYSTIEVEEVGSQQRGYSY